VPPEILDLADGVDVLIHDAQHTCEEFEHKRHFGHSTVDYAVHVARVAGARRLVLFHHCPSHSDDTVDLMHLYGSALAERVAAGPGRRGAPRGPDGTAGGGGGGVVE